MSDATADELYEQYIYTLERCIPPVISKPDPELLYDLFEEFDIGVRSYMHDVCLNVLFQAGMINSEIVEASKDIRTRWLALQRRSWTIDEIKTNSEWRDLFALCGALKARLKG